MAHEIVAQRRRTRGCVAAPHAPVVDHPVREVARRDLEVWRKRRLLESFEKPGGRNDDQKI